MTWLERGAAGRVAALAIAIVASGCGGLPASAPVGTATVARVERVAWNSEPEPGLFRVTFDEQRAAQILTRAGFVRAPESLDPYFSELDGIEEEASRELRGKGLCGSSVKLASPVEGTPGRGITALFKCRPTVF